MSSLWDRVLRLCPRRLHATAVHKAHEATVRRRKTMRQSPHSGKACGINLGAMLTPQLSNDGKDWASTAELFAICVAD